MLEEQACPVTPSTIPLVHQDISGAELAVSLSEMNQEMISEEAGSGCWSQIFLILATAPIRMSDSSTEKSWEFILPNSPMMRYLGRGLTRRAPGCAGGPVEHG